MPDYLHTNGYTYTEEEVLNAAKKKKQTLEQYLADTPELSLTGEEDVSEAGKIEGPQIPDVAAGPQIAPEGTESTSEEPSLDLQLPDI